MENSKKMKKKPSKAKTDIKAQINNEIIHAQGKFKQAKVGTIRNLVKKLKHPEKNPKQNLVAKTERFQNVLNQIKHMSPKRLGLLALIYHKSGKNYLADPQSTVEQLAVGYYSQFKGLNSTLDVIRNKLNLENAPDWQKLAKKLFKKKDKTIKEEKGENKKKKNAFVESENGESNESKSGKSNGKQDKPSKSPNKKQEKQTGSTQKSPATPASESESDESSESGAAEDDTKCLPAPTTVDDFFITADGSNYLSTAVASHKNDDDSDDDLKVHMKHGKGFAKKSNESSFFQKNNKKPVKLATTRPEAAMKRKWSDDKEEQIDSGKQLKTVDPNLHPSWLAKQKLKPTITEFKGKKITFD